MKFAAWPGKKSASWLALRRRQWPNTAGKSPTTEEEPLEGVRFSARSVRAQRRRLGLSAADYGRLVGVSALTIYNWESGKSRPRQAPFAAVVAVRGIGKREAAERLASLDDPAAE
jgi:DNA-binding transcriptional regulator YiaG